MKYRFTMDLPLALVLAASLTIGATACASGGAGPAPATGTTTPELQGEEIPVGEEERRNDMTRAAADALEEGRGILREAEESEEMTMDAARAEARPLFQTALDQARSAIAADSTNPLPWYQAGLANIGLENYEQAGEALDRAEELRPIYQLEIEPLRERTWINLFTEAQPHLNAGEYDEAARLLEQANYIYEGRPEVKIVLGQIYATRDRHEESVELFREAITILESDAIEQVDSATAAQWMEYQETLPLAVGDALIAAERYDEAAEQLRMLLADDPDNVLLARNLASVYLRLEQPDSAAAIYDDLMDRPNLNAVDLYQIGVGLYNIEQYREAADAFDEALSDSRWHRDAAEMEARSLQLMMGSLPEGETPDTATMEELSEAANRWLELDPYSRNAHLITAQAANQLGNQERARELVEAIEALPVVIENLQLQQTGSGASVYGQLTNVSQPAGANITVNVHFYGADGEMIGSEEVLTQLPAQEASQAIRVDFQTEESVLGYTYEIEGLQ